MEKDQTQDSGKAEDIKAELERKNEEMLEQERLGESFFHYQEGCAQGPISFVQFGNSNLDLIFSLDHRSVRP